MKAALRRVVMLTLACAVVPCASAQTLEDRFFDSDGVRIRYIDQGRGTPIVLIHGLLTDLQIWVDLGTVAKLAHDHRVIALDLRGNGKSDKPTSPTAYTGQLTADIVRLLDHLGISRAHIVGYSLGGALVAKLLTEHPERFLTATIGASGGHRHPKVETRRDIGDDTVPFAVYYRGGHRDTYFSDEQFAAVKVPVLGIVGSEDPSLAGMKELKALLPAMKLVILDGATHVGATGAPRRREFIEEIRAFTRAHDIESARR